MDTYCVYIHIYNGPLFPHPMFYIGQAKGDPCIRWGVDGSGYATQLFGKTLKENNINWDDLTHSVLKANLSKKEADELECYYIDKYNSLFCNGHGWNVYYGNKSMKTGLQITNHPTQKNELEKEVWTYIENKIKEANRKCEFVFDFSMFQNKKTDIIKTINNIASNKISINYNMRNFFITPFTTKTLSNGKLWIKVNELLVLNY